MSDDSTELQRQEGMAWFGRRPAPDPRDANFPLRTTPQQQQEAAATEARYWYSSDVLNQGPTPHCVAYSGVHFLRAGPVRNLTNLPEPVRLYDECQRIDEWAGEDYDGTSVRALFKVLKARGYITSYVWTTHVETLVTHLLTKGPLILGTDWYENMSTPDAAGFLDDSGSWLGGHAYTIIGANRARRCPDGSVGAARVLNSWGRDWAEAGRAWLPFTTMQRLLNAQGEACTAEEVRVA